MAGEHLQSGKVAYALQQATLFHRLLKRCEQAWCYVDDYVKLAEVDDTFGKNADDDDEGEG